jgi:hypothetical protein
MISRILASTNYKNQHYKKLSQNSLFKADKSDMESFNIIFRYSKWLPRDAIKVGDELLKYLVGQGERKAKPADVERIAQQTLLRGKYKIQVAESKS